VSSVQQRGGERGGARSSQDRHHSPSRAAEGHTAPRRPPPAPTPVALTIAGSDSGGGAGIQADLKAFARCGVHGTSAITAITAQNTKGVNAVSHVEPEVVLAQVRAVLEDLPVGAVKVGMVGSAEVALAVAQALAELPAGVPVVVDPVMVSESGGRLLDSDAESVLVERILPLASVLTPNLPEARVLARRGPPPQGELRSEAEQRQEARELVRAVLALGPGAVVLTGGHRTRAVDLFLAADPGVAADPRAAADPGAAADRGSGASPDAGRAGLSSSRDVQDERIVEIPGERHPDGAAHGSGCTHSSVLAAKLALGSTPLQAARSARALAGEAVASGLRELGGGAGPVDVLRLERMRADRAGGGRRA
jgi:hydroxymethylpyrimidine/phosphomethylpyrimidine kinase